MRAHHSSVGGVESGNMVNPVGDKNEDKVPGGGEEKTPVPTAWLVQKVAEGRKALTS